MFFYTGSSLKPFVEPSSASTGNFSARENSRARDAFKPGPVQDGRTSPDPKTAVDLEKPTQPVLRKEEISKKLLADQIGDDKNPRETSLPHHAEEAPIKSHNTPLPAAGAADESNQSDHSSGETLRLQTSKYSSSQGPADSEGGTESTLNETALEIGSSKKVSTLEAESTEEGAATEAIMTKKKPGMMRNSVSHHSQTFRTIAPPESES
jgi:hypothetical protein